MNHTGERTGDEAEKVDLYQILKDFSVMLFFPLGTGGEEFDKILCNRITWLNLCC